MKKQNKKNKVGVRGVSIQMHHKPLAAAMCVFVEGVHAFVEPKDLSSVCCWLWQPAVRGAQGERGGQVKGGPAADGDWSQRSLTPNEW